MAATSASRACSACGARRQGVTPGASVHEAPRSERACATRAPSSPRFGAVRGAARLARPYRPCRDAPAGGKHARVSLGEDASAHPVARRRPRRRRAVCVHLRAACEGDRGLRAVVGGLSGPPAVAGSLSAAQRAAGDPGAGCVLGTAGGPRRGRRGSPREGSLIGCVWLGCTLLQYYCAVRRSRDTRHAAIGCARAGPRGAGGAMPCGAAETHSTLQSAAPAQGAPPCLFAVATVTTKSSRVAPWWIDGRGGLRGVSQNTVCGGLRHLLSV